MFLSAKNCNREQLTLFRGFVKHHGKTKLRRLILSLERNHSKTAIAHQLSLPIDAVDDIAQIYRRSA